MCLPSLDGVTSVQGSGIWVSTQASFRGGVSTAGSSWGDSRSDVALLLHCFTDGEAIGCSSTFFFLRPLGLPGLDGVMSVEGSGIWVSTQPSFRGGVSTAGSSWGDSRSDVALFLHCFTDGEAIGCSSTFFFLRPLGLPGLDGVTSVEGSGIWVSTQASFRGGVSTAGSSWGESRSDVALLLHCFTDGEAIGCSSTFFFLRPLGLPGLDGVTSVEGSGIWVSTQASFRAGVSTAGSSWGDSRSDVALFLHCFTDGEAIGCSSTFFFLRPLGLPGLDGVTSVEGSGIWVSTQASFRGGVSTAGSSWGDSRSDVALLLHCFTDGEAIGCSSTFFFLRPLGLPGLDGVTSVEGSGIWVSTQASFRGGVSTAGSSWGESRSDVALLLHCFTDGEAIGCSSTFFFLWPLGLPAATNPWGLDSVTSVGGV